MVRRFNDQEVNEQTGLPEPGRYLAEVVSADERFSKKGDSMYVVKFRRVNGGASLCADFVMLGGAGMGMGLKKLEALGAARHVGEEWEVDESHELTGKQVELEIIHETYNGKTQARVDGKAKNNGYTPIARALGDAPGAGYSAPLSQTDEDEMPF